jgi:hypothetical protein
MMPQPLYMYGAPEGLIRPGNIDLNARPKVRNKDGSISTVRSFSFSGPDGVEYLVPTVSDDGRILSDEDAIGMFYKTQRHLGMFASPGLADAYAKYLHEQQAKQYLRPGLLGVKK